jgi:hypothetical protein
MGLDVCVLFEIKAKDEGKMKAESRQNQGKTV